jgi:hypothetical protein
MRRRDTKNQFEFGAAFIEFAVTLPILLTLVAGAINYGYMLLQIQVMSEAVRHSARTAATKSNDGHTCSELLTIAQSAFDTYVDSHSNNTSDIKENWWGDAEVCLQTRMWDIGLTDQFVRVSVNNGIDERCLFCFNQIWSRNPITVASSFKLEWACQGTGLPAC